jgi:hypothetical protein
MYNLCTIKCKKKIASKKKRKNKTLPLCAMTTSSAARDTVNTTEGTSSSPSLPSLCLTLLYPNAQVYYFGEQVLGLLAVEQANFVLKASAPSNIEVVVADAGNIHVLKS